MTKLAVIKSERPSSPLESSLAALARIEAEDREIGEAIARLEGVAREAAALDGELAEVAQREAADLVEWSRNPTGSAPGLREAERRRLDAKAAEARARQAAAQAALGRLHAQRNEIAGRRKAAIAQIENHAAEFMTAEASTLIGELETAATKLMALRAKLEGLREAAISVAFSREDGAMRGQLLALAESVSRRAPNTAMRPAEPAEIGPQAVAWRAALANVTGGLVGGDV